MKLFFLTFITLEVGAYFWWFQAWRALQRCNIHETFCKIQQNTSKNQTKFAYLAKMTNWFLLIILGNKAK
jgi:hypothetical protein